MAQEMSPEKYAAHVGIPLTTVEAWINGNGAVLFDPRDIRRVHQRLVMIAVQAPNAAGQGARPNWITNPAYKYERKRKSVHEATGASTVQVVGVQSTGFGAVTHPTPEHIERDSALGMVGSESMPKGFQVSDAKAGGAHA